MPKGDFKVIINGHGDLGKIKNRSIEEIAKYISTIDQATGENSSMLSTSHFLSLTWDSSAT
jgi:hypothetical protein